MLSLALTSAPWSTSAWIASGLPAAAACISGVTPVNPGVLASAPDFSRRSIMRVLPFCEASQMGVIEPSRVVALAFAPAYKSICAISRSSFEAAQ